MHHQNSDSQKESCAEGNVAKNFPNRLTAGDTFSQAERDRHSNEKQKRRKYKIDESHTAAAAVPIGEMNHPVRHNCASASKVIDKDHHEHDKSAQGVDGLNT
jgi:hypothetical protein